MTLIVNNTTIDNIIVRDRASGVETPLDLFQDSNGVEIWAGFKKLEQLIDRSIESVTTEDLYGVTSIGDYAFAYCKGLTNISLPASVSVIGNYAFSNCKGLTNITLPEGVVEIGGYAFESLSTLTISQQLEGEIVTINLPSTLLSIGAYAFEYCKLVELTIPSGVTSLSTRVFFGCYDLTTLKMLPLTPPTLASGASDLIISSGITRIEVPSASLSAYQTDKNWSSVADKMVGV